MGLRLRGTGVGNTAGGRLHEHGVRGARGGGSSGSGGAAGGRQGSKQAGDSCSTSVAQAPCRDGEAPVGRVISHDGVIRTCVWRAQENKWIHKVTPQHQIHEHSYIVFRVEE